jgi:putative colanic acid biosynthesis UDP-glucose lipid carrier transferase
MLRIPSRSFQPEADQFRYIGRFRQYSAFLVRTALLLDASTLYGCLFISVRLNGFSWNQRYVTLALLSIILFGLVTSVRGIYRPWRLEPLWKEIVEALIFNTLSFVALIVVLATVTQWGTDQDNRKILAVWWILAMIGIVCTRIMLRLILQIKRTPRRQIAFYGITQTAQRLAQVFRENPWLGCEVVGFYDDNSDKTPCEHVVASGCLDALVQRAHDGYIDSVYITVRNASEVRIKQIVEKFSDTTLSLHYCPAVFDLNLLGARWDDVLGQPVITVVDSPFDEFNRHLKRLEDMVLTIFILPIALLLAVPIAIAIKLTSPGPVLYRQSRCGLDGRQFKIWKFRTMYKTDSDEEFIQAKFNDARITPIGAFLRRTSLDELPQFFNVIKGEMSIVGPRPFPVKYNEEQRRNINRLMLRHKVKPGITGLAQVNGFRGETDRQELLQQRIMYDLQYIDNWSLWLDLKIFSRTAAQLIAEVTCR